MAFKNLSTGRKGYPFDFAEFICDKEDDVASLPTHINKNGYRDTVCAGSIAFVVDTSTYYMLNTLNDWVKVDIGSGGGGCGQIVGL